MPQLYTITYVFEGSPQAKATFDKAEADRIARREQQNGSVVYLATNDYVGEVSPAHSKPIILLDLNYTLVANSRESWPKFNKDPKLEIEIYRNWLVELIKGHHVCLITVREERLTERTLANIRQKTGWQPQESYFKPAPEKFIKAHIFKQRVLQRFVFPRHGTDPRRYLALESNSKTREMYHSINIQAVKVPYRPWVSLPPLSPLTGGTSPRSQAHLW